MTSSFNMIHHDSSLFIMIQPSIQAISSYFIIFQHISIWCDHYVTIWLENFPIFKDRLQGRILSPPGDVTSDTKSDTSGSREELLGALVQPLSSTTFHLVSSCFYFFSFFHPFFILFRLCRVMFWDVLSICSWKLMNFWSINRICTAHATTIVWIRR
jgi:hypothetical protein